MRFQTIQILKEDFQSFIQPEAPQDEIQALYGTTMKSLSEDLEVPDDVLNSFQIKDELNPEVWDKNHLKPELRPKLLKIAVDFFKNLKLPKEIRLTDVLLLGSLANFNWSKFSDVDLHLVVDFSAFKENPTFVQEFFDAQKNLWNTDHDITIAGYPVEVYVQNKTTKTESTAVYSVAKDKWLLKPDKINFKLDKELVTKKVDRFFDLLKIIKNAYEQKDFKKVVAYVEKLKKIIKQMRKAGLEKGGEFSTENIVFKVLRRTDFMEILDSYKNKSYDQIVSVKEEMP